MQTEAMVMGATGGPEVLERATIELAEPGAREVRIRVRAVALNHIDLWARRGLPHFRYEFPHRLGADVAGEVEALGPGVNSAKVGDRIVVNPGLSCGACERCLLGEDTFCRSYKIMGENTQGGYARHIVVPDANLLPMPKGLSFTDAAAIPLCFLTAWQMVVRKAQVRPGQTVLVQAAGSGVSSAAIQIAKMLGARVITTTSTDEKAARAKALGADEVINYTTHDFVAECKRLTDKKGVDVVIEEFVRARHARRASRLTRSRRSWTQFARASRDRFFICIESTDPNFGDGSGVKTFLATLHPESIAEVPE